MMDNTKIDKNELNTLPECPGVYQYYNSKGEIIYIGKAKNLRKRVNSYFKANHDAVKTSILVKNISYMRYIAVETEEDALQLENNLIKKFQPRYNILLKDGKSYPSICITNESFPRIIKTRNIIRNGSKYFGPYSSNYTINSLLEVIHEIYPIRTCKLNLTTENIKANKFKVCLQYHIHKCNGPCEDKESKLEYGEYIKQVTQIIEGDANEISKLFLNKMKYLAEQYKFEEANTFKEKFELFERYKSKSIITNTLIEDTDVFAYDEDENNAYVNILRISKGSIIQGYTVECKKKLNETKEEILEMAIVELRAKLKSNSNEILLPFKINVQFKGVNIKIPERGDRKKILDLSIQNVKQYKFDRLKQNEKLNPDQKFVKILDDCKEKLQLTKLPIRIECYDNSNIQGFDPVAVCVVYYKGKPLKKEYRKYNINTVEGPDDYASLNEVLMRRYSRLINEELPLPDLIIADGGTAHMEIIRKVIVDKFKLNIAIIGLSKDSKHKTSEVLIGFPSKVVGLKPNDTLFKFLAEIQNEVHRFAISFHRNKRSKNQTKSELDEIPGIGEKTLFDLIKHFKSVKRVKVATLSELKSIIGTNRASIVYDYFNLSKNA